jgi:hypothetical protein
LPKLYDRGWRQGTLLRAELEAHGWVVGDGDQPRVDPLQHGLWIVVTQDCDLNSLDEADDVTSVELRPVFEENPPQTLGIRSRMLKLMPGMPYYLQAQSRREMISPAGLVKLTKDREKLLDDVRLTALKTWLGKRYDRPAVPDGFVPLAKAIATAMKGHRHDRILDGVRDVLVQFADGDTIRVSMFAVVTDEANKDEVERLLAEIAQDIPAELGIVDDIAVGTSAEVSLKVIEDSFAVDATDITWRGEAPRGALQ